MKLYWALYFMVLWTTSHSRNCATSSCTSKPSSTIHVQMGAHSHLDAFWLQTYSEYMDGSGHDGVHYWVNVKKLYSGVLAALKKDPKRTYQMAEVCYIQPWYESLSEDDQLSFKQMIQSGQIEILNGGWVQNDEACPYYDDIIDQLTVGHQFLYKTFGVVPTVAFNVDNFGHSMAQAAIYSQMGFNAYIIARLDTEDIREKTKTGNLEFLWEPHQSTGVFKDSLLTQIRYKRHGPWPWHNEGVRQEDCNSLESTFYPFEKYMSEASKAYGSKDIYYYAGDDFQFFNEDRFQALEALINYYKDRPCKGFDVDFSAPSKYFKELVERRTSQKNFQWIKKTTDFFPYWEDGLYWTGLSFFTSSPDYKIMFRDASRYLQSLRKLITYAALSEHFSKESITAMLPHVQRFQEEISLAQHHDGISATSKYRVMDDVVNRITKTWKNLHSFEKDLVIGLIRADQPKDELPKDHSSLHQCSLFANAEQEAPGCIDLLKKHNTVLLALYNPQTDQPKYQFVIRLEKAVYGQLYDEFGYLINGDIVCESEDECWIYSTLTLPGFSMSYFYLKKIDKADLQCRFQQQTLDTIHQHADVVYDTGKDYYSIIDNSEKKSQSKFVVFKDMQTFQLTYVLNEDGDSETYEFKLGIERYKGTSSQQWSNWDNHYFWSQCGKYVMMNDNKRTTFATPKFLTSVNTKRFVQFIVRWNKVAVSVLTFYKSDTQGLVDLVTRWDGMQLPQEWGDYTLVIRETSIKDHKFFVDANGLTMTQRRNNWREDFTPVYNATDKVPGNYYPMTAAAYVEGKQRRLVVMTDRSQGVASFNDGEIEINIDRLAGEDGRGVGDTLSKRGEYTFQHKLLFQTGQKAFFPEYHRWDDKTLLYMTGVKQELTFNSWFKNTSFASDFRVTSLPFSEHEFVIRIQNTNEVESKSLSDFSGEKGTALLSLLGRLDKSYTATIEEKTLNGVRNLQEAIKEKWLKAQDLDETLLKNYATLKLAPRQIRTFKIDISKVSTQEVTVTSRPPPPPQPTQTTLRSGSASSKSNLINSSTIVQPTIVSIIESSNSPQPEIDIELEDDDRVGDRDSIRKQVLAGQRPELVCLSIYILAAQVVLPFLL